MKFVYFSIPIYIFILFASPARAASVGDVVINEIAWMGTVNSYHQEWFELYNNTSSSVPLDGWVLRSTDGKPSIVLEGNVAAHRFFLLEKSSSATPLTPTANQVYTGSLMLNSGEHLELADGAGNIIDNINAFGNWFAGDNTTKNTMERKNPSLTGSDPVSWATSIDVGGTPKAQNSVYQPDNLTLPPPPAEPTPTPAPSEPDPASNSIEEYISIPTESPTQNPSSTEQTPYEDSAPQSNTNQSKSTEGSPATSSIKATPPQSYPSNIFINEVMPYPLGPDAQEEWVELINENDGPSDISRWQIKDTVGAINTYTLPQGTIISANSYLVFSRPTTKITMNNSNDALQLIRPDGELIQTVTYKKAPKGKSYVRVNGVWDWSAVPTPGSANILPIPPKKAGTIKDIKKIVKKTANNNDSGDAANDRDNGAVSNNSSSLLSPPLTASIGETASIKSSSRITAFVASLIAFLSAIFIFILKRRLSKP